MLKVFLVDDEYYERLSLINTIPWNDLDMKVCGEANNGLTAYEMMIKDPPDIAIVDINMPKLNGLDLIARLNQNNISCQYIILTGYDDFKYAQQAIHLEVAEYILKPINYQNLVDTLYKLQTKIEQHRQDISILQTLSTENKRFQLERYYNDLVNCNFSLQSMEQYEKNLLMELRLGYDTYCIAVLENTKRLSLEQLYFLQNEYSAAFDRDTFVVCLDNKRRLFFILNYDRLSSDPDLIQKIMKLAEAQELICHVGVGNPCCQLEKIFLSYNEACIALHNCTIRRINLVYYSEVHMDHTPCLDSKKKNILRAMITGKELGKLTTFLNTLYSDFENERLPWDIIVLHTLELINLLTECLSSRMETSISIINTDGSILDTLNNKKNVSELLDWLSDIYITSIKNIRDKDAYSNITRSVESYILEHYIDPDLSITMISKELFLNYSYLCYCFKRDKQMTINDYISQVRINKAIELFQNKIEHIGFIAEKTGFSSASYFSKQFKKVTGLSPSEYLKSLESSL